MSASRDQSQKIAFVYSNLHQLYKKGKAAAQDAEVPAPSSAPAQAEAAVVLPNSRVLKTEDLNKPEHAAVKISSYNPTELIGKRVARPASIPAQNAAPKEAISGLKDNLKALNDLHSRLRFMLQELEDLVKN